MSLLSCKVTYSPIPRLGHGHFGEANIQSTTVSFNEENCFVFSILGSSRETESVGDIAASLWEEICYKELALGNMEVDKSQDLQSELASWRPRKS